MDYNEYLLWWLSMFLFESFISYAEFDSNMDQLDVKTAFLHGTFNKVIYMSAIRVQIERE